MPISASTGFQSDDVTRDKGEILSIREMIASMIDLHGVDPRRVFVTGLSAGGAYGQALLASYPEVFTGGAISQAFLLVSPPLLPKHLIGCGDMVFHRPLRWMPS